MNSDLEILRHSTSHLMAQAVKQLFPGVKIAIGPSIDTGFYYDFDSDKPFTPEDIDKIEVRMGELVKADIPIVRKEISRQEAIDYFSSINEPYKVELLNEIPDEIVSVYTQGNFTDLCRGPHLPSTCAIKAFKLLSVAGAYWRGDEKNKMLQRIYGTAFLLQAQLDDYLFKLEEAKKRDHRKLGKDLELFTINDEIGAGLILWHPKGALLRKTIEDFWKEEHYKHGYEMVITPHIARLDLWQTSGHLDFYVENMYSPIDIEGVKYQLKPMNCPFHISLFKSGLKSYREFPVRWCELGTVYRYERAGVLHGLLRVRGFTQDDAHIFVRSDQLEDEIFKIIDLNIFILSTFGFRDYEIYLSTMPEKYVGSEENWDKATNSLKMALEKKGLAYSIDPGEGVFYGPKIDIKIKDVLDRSWQCSTIQVDFNLPERFNITYIGENGKEHQPIMIHRALMGSLERFIGVLIEHYNGAFPAWLAPVQAVIMTVTDRQNDYCNTVYKEFFLNGIRVQSDTRNEKLGYKIREAQLKKIPYMVILGDKEEKNQTVSPRTRSGKDLKEMELSDLITMIKQEIELKN